MDNALNQKRELIQNLIRDVQADIEEYRALRTMLKQQKALMHRLDTQQLELHNNHQTILCDKLTFRARKRSNNLKQLGFHHDDKGMLKFINALPFRLKPQVNNAWNELQILVKECQRENTENGRLLAMQHSSIQEILRNCANIQEQIDYGEPELF